MIRIASLACLYVLVAPQVHAQSAPNQVHTSPQADPGVYSGRLKVDYRVHAYVEQAAPVHDGGLQFGKSLEN